MTRRQVGALGLAGALLVTGCGKKGNPLPPIRPVPARVADLSAHRVGDRIDLQLTVPNANADATSPLTITRVEIFRAPVLEGAAPLSQAQIMGRSRNLIAEIDVRRPDGPALTADGTPVPVPGEKITVSDRIDSNQAASATAWSYLAVATAGRGRRGQTSAIVTVPIGPLPAAPEGLTFTQTETTLTLSWKPAAAGHVFNVFAVASATDQAPGELLTPKPLTTGTFAMPIQFGRERCLVVQTFIAAAGALVDGARSGVTCVTPADTFPPPAPTKLAATVDSGAVTLTWTPVVSADLAGYVVLRGDATGIDMRPLQRDPIRETTFRDTTVQPGQTYTYSVYAADNAPTPNISQQSNREVVTAR